MADRKAITPEEEMRLAEQSQRIYIIATHWFDEITVAARQGDRVRMRVAMVAHEMCRAAHLNLRASWPTS